jgi:hypothetical protein
MEYDTPPPETQDLDQEQPLAPIVADPPPLSTALPSPQATSVMLAGALLVTLFRDQFAKTKEEKRLSLDALAEIIRITRAPTKAALRWLKLARFGDLRSDRGSLRHDDNVIVITGVEGDIDNGKQSFDEASETLRRARIRGLIYTSPSHTEDHPRLRVLCPLSKERTPDQRDRMMRRLNGLLGGNCAGESFSLSQSYYYGAVGDNPLPRVEIIDGDFVDLRDDLDATAMGKEPDQGAGSRRKTTATVINLPGSSPAIMAQRQASRWPMQGGVSGLFIYSASPMPGIVALLRHGRSCSNGARRAANSKASRISTETGTRSIPADRTGSLSQP